MNPRQNPYAPGAGTLPPQLSGRDDIIEQVSIELDRCKSGLAYRSFLMVGLRGVGKTVLLNQLSINAEADGFAVVSIETPEKRSLPALLIPALRSALLKLDHFSAVGDLGKKALRVLGGFLNAMKLKYEDIEFGLDLGHEVGLADSGDLENDLVINRNTLHTVSITSIALNHSSVKMDYTDMNCQSQTIQQMQLH